MIDMGWRDASGRSVEVWICKSGKLSEPVLLIRRSMRCRTAMSGPLAYAILVAPVVGKRD